MQQQQESQDPIEVPMRYDDIMLFINASDDSFTGKYGGQFYGPFAPGDTLYVYAPIARHIAKQLTNREMKIRYGHIMQKKEKRYQDFYNKCLNGGKRVNVQNPSVANMTIQEQVMADDAAIRDRVEILERARKFREQGHDEAKAEKLARQEMVAEVKKSKDDGEMAQRVELAKRATPGIDKMEIESEPVEELTLEEELQQDIPNMDLSHIGKVSIKDTGIESVEFEGKESAAVSSILSAAQKKAMTDDKVKPENRA